MDNRIIIFDTTLRDGEQTPGVNLNLSEKLEIAGQLERLGADVIEAGFPAASTGDFESVAAVAATSGCTVAALCRCVEGDIRTAWEAVRCASKPRLHLFIATSDIHMQYKLKMSRTAVLEQAVRSIRLAKTLCDDIEFSCEDASRSDIDFLAEMVTAALEAGAGTINIPDTVGYAVPEEFASLIRQLRARVPGLDQAVLSVHCHNDLGLATANTLAALGAGARQAEVTINGIGERAGNCALEEVVMALKTRESQLGLETGVDATGIYRTARLVERLTAMGIPACKAVVGGNAFAHESGIHQHGMLENPMTYEIMTPQSIGKNASTMVLGKHSGRHAFSEHLIQLGCPLTGDALDQAFVQFKALSDRKKTVSDEDMMALALHKIAPVPDFYALERFQVQSGNCIQSVASVTLLHEGESKTEAATGEGPIDAALSTVARIVGGHWPLEAYNIKAVSGGEDALGEVTVRVGYGGRSYSGKGLADDIIEASIRAYIDAINRIFAQAARDEIDITEGREAV